MAGEACIYEAIRRPRGRGKKGSLYATKPVDLIAGLIGELPSRFPDLDPAYTDDLVLGVVTPVGDQGSDIAKAAALVAGLPGTADGVQINRFCASGLEATSLAAQKVRSGSGQLALVGGVESMSRVPMMSDGGPLFTDPATADDHYFVPQGRFKRSIVPVTDGNGVTVVDQGEHCRPGSAVDSLGPLTLSFNQARHDLAVALQKYHHLERITHVHTSGNSSGVVDGAALVLVGTERAGLHLGLRPRAWVVATAITGSDPTIMLTGPTPATEAAGQTWPSYDCDAVFGRLIEKFGRAGGAGSCARDASGRRAGLGAGLRQHFPAAGPEVPFADMKERLLFAETLEARYAYDSGVIESAADANVGSPLGIGFPIWTGGVLRHIDQYDGGPPPGFARCAAELAGRCGPRFTPPASLLAAVAQHVAA